MPSRLGLTVVSVLEGTRMIAVLGSSEDLRKGLLGSVPSGLGLPRVRLSRWFIAQPLRMAGVWWGK